MAWPIRKLSEILLPIPSSVKLAKKNMLKTGEFRVIDQGQSFISGYSNDKSDLYQGDLPVIIFGDHTLTLKFIDFPFVRGSDGTQILKPKEEVDTKFLFYQLLSKPLANHGYSRHFKYLKELNIPIPPLKIQQKIVERLDAIRQAQELNDLQISKTQELFESLINTQIKRKNNILKLSDLCKFQYGYTQSAKQNGEYRFVRITDIDDSGCLRNLDKKYISDELKLIEAYLLNDGDLLVARTGATYGKILNIFPEEPSVFASFLIRILPDKTKILPQYVWAFSRTINYREQAKRLVTGSGQPQFNANKISQIEIPTPPLSDQRKIVEKLNAIQDYKKSLLKQKELLIV